MNNNIFHEILSKKGIADKIARAFELGLLIKDRVIGYYSYKIPSKFLGSVGIIFPVRDLYGNIVSIYLRRLSKDGPKYNSLPFDKDILFGLNRTFPFIYKQGAILVEGPFDVLALLSHKIYNVCALLGTSINIYQIALLKRLTDKCFVMMDGDVIGRAKNVEIRDKLIYYGFDARIIQLPPGYDPDTYITQFKTLPQGGC